MMQLRRVIGSSWMLPLVPWLTVIVVVQHCHIASSASVRLAVPVSWRQAGRVVSVPSTRTVPGHHISHRRRRPGGCHAPNDYDDKQEGTTLCSSSFSSPSTIPRCGESQTKKSMTATQMQLLQILSGGLAGTIAACLTNPLEVIKAQLQSSSTSVTAGGSLAAAAGHPLTVAQQVLAMDGLTGFFRGLRSTLVGIIPARSAYFYTYEQTKQSLDKLSPNTTPQGSAPNALLAGLAAGIVGNTLTNPIWMVRTRMQLLADQAAGQTAYKSYREVIASIAQNEGLGGFYKGIFASYWGCLEGSLQFVMYEHMKRKLQKRQLQRHFSSSSSSHSTRKQQRQATQELSLSKASYFWSAAIAKGIASIATYPHEVARTRLREQARSGVYKYKGMWQTLKVVAQEEGVGKLYGGLGIHLLKVVPNSAIMFLTYEVVNGWLSRFTVLEE